MEILVCPNCQIRVAVGEDGTCPGCRRHLIGSSSADTPVAENRDRPPADAALPSEARPISDQPPKVPEPAETHFDMFRVCFSLKGRIPRSVYWIAEIGTLAPMAALGNEPTTVPLVWLLVGPLFLWIQLAVCVKRFHDLGMSGFWVPIALLPGLGPIVQFVLLGLHRGLHGENKYGRDPLELFT